MTPALKQKLVSGVRRGSLATRPLPKHMPKHNRFIDRKAKFGQSAGMFNVQKLIPKRTIYSFYVEDWFHTLVNTRLIRIALVVLFTYLFLFTFFASLYMLSSDECLPDLKVSNSSSPTATRFLLATFFSVETFFTIGYSAVDPAFGQCPWLLVLISFEALCGVLSQSLLIGIVFARISRADRRACTLAFSSRAIIRAAQGELYFVLRVAEIRKHQLTNAQVNLHALCNSANVIGDEDAHTQGSSVHALPMNLEHPKGQMLLAIPCFIVHKLDAHSPLTPFAEDEEGQEAQPTSKDVELPQLLRALQAQPTKRTSSVNLRAILPYGGATSPCSSCSPSLRTTLEQSPRTTRDGDALDSEPGAFSGLGGEAAATAVREQHLLLLSRMKRIKHHLREIEAEIIVCLEGTDATTSNTVQARQSYTFDDIVFDGTFEPCARRQAHGGIIVNFEKLHSIRPLHQLDPGSSLPILPGLP